MRLSEQSSEEYGT